MVTVIGCAVLLVGCVELVAVELDVVEHPTSDNAAIAAMPSAMKLFLTYITSEFYKGDGRQSRNVTGIYLGHSYPLIPQGHRFNGCIFMQPRITSERSQRLKQTTDTYKLQQ